MGKKQKRGKAGNAAQYLTRNQAIKKLQLRLSEFRRLCILKGIHPREPKKKVRGAHKTYYHVKDINWLAHEPLIATFRAVKVHERRVCRARAKQNLGLARRLLAAKPGYKLDHLIKERYPSFIDALRDLDDPLTLVHLFATLPGEATAGIAPATVDKCRRLVLEWSAYVARTSSLRKVFVSVKGFYYQADVAGCAVTWLVPHQLAQVLPPDVDYTVLLTFLEFYCSLVQFVMFKLYHNLGLRYPPVMDRRLEEAAAGLAGIMQDIAAAAADAQQQQQQLEGGSSSGDGAAAGDGSSGGGNAAAAAALPDVVQRLGTLGKKIQELQQQQQQQQGGAAAAAAADAEDDSESLPDIDSGGGEEDQEEEEEEGSEAAGEGEGSEEEQSSEGEGEESSSEEAEDDDSEQQQQEGDDAAAAAVGDEAAAGRADAAAAAAAAAAAGLPGASVAGGGLGEVDADDDAGLCGVLLKGCVFYLAREVPREPLLFMIRSFGGTAGWDGPGSPYSQADEVITHQIVDRPTQGHRFLSRAYVQPQWLFDSINHRVLLPVELYAPGAAPPPHLSPFVDNEAEGYTPEYATKIKQLQEAARAARRAAAGLASDAAFLEDGQAAAAAATEPAAAEDEAAAEKVYRQELAKELRAAQGLAGTQGDSEGEGAQSSGESESENESESAGDESPDDEPAAAAGAGKKKGSGKAAAAAAAAGDGGKKGSGKAAAAAAGTKRPAAGEDEEAAMADIMMTRKNRKLYARINRAIEGKAERVAALEQRKAALAADGGQQQGQESSRKKKKTK